MFAAGGVRAQPSRQTRAEEASRAMKVPLNYHKDRLAPPDLKGSLAILSALARFFRLPERPIARRPRRRHRACAPVQPSPGTTVFK
jgi:hypothetical protein